MKDRLIMTILQVIKDVNGLKLKLLRAVETEAYAELFHIVNRNSPEVSIRDYEDDVFVNKLFKIIGGLERDRD